MKKMFVFSALMFLIPSFCSAHWADSQIEVLQKNEILQEVFDVNEIEQILNRSITREEFFSLIAVADDIVESEPNKTFLDFNEVNSKFSLYIGGLINSGVIEGVPENGGLYVKPKH